MVKRKKKTKSLLSSKHFVLGVFIGILIVAGAFFIKKHFLPVKGNLQAQKPYYCAVNSCPYSVYGNNPVSSPTEVPLSGFCLHVPVLTYHHIQPQSVAEELGQTALSVDSGVFDQQMAYLSSQGYTPIFVDELINALKTQSQLPGKPIVVSMDDGYADNYVYALPVLRKYGIKANLMLASGLVGSNSDMLSWDQVKDMKGSGLIFLTNHTWSHYSMIRSSQAKIESEIDTAQSQITQYTGQNTNIFTYPYGEFNDNAIRTLQSKGYIGAFSTIPGSYQCDSFIMSLHRTRIGNASLSNYGI